MSSAAYHPKDAGELVATHVVDEVGGLDAVGDDVAVWFDAVVVDVLEHPADVVLVLAVEDVDVDVPVEIKSARRRLASGSRGRFYIRQRQHERLVEEDGLYLFAVYEPTDDLPIVAIAVVPARDVDELLPDGWTPVRGRRAELGYRQLTWTNVLDADVVEGGDRA